MTHGHLHDSWALRINDKLVWTDAIRLSGDIEAARTRPFGFGEAAGYATLVVAGREAASHLDAARAIAAASRARSNGATLVNGVMILRLMDDDAARLRTAVVHCLAELRGVVTGRAASLPRAWSL
jgi:urease accessory protein